MGQLSKKVALVTGAAAGIGLSISEALAAEGAVVYLTDIDDERGERAAEKINQSGGTAFYLTQDTRFEERWQEVISVISRDQGRLDVLVNNAGIAMSVSILEMSLEDFQRQNAINVEGVFLGMKHAAPLMAAEEGGSIINLSSIAGLKGAPGLAGYSASKGAVKLLSQSAALEFAQAGMGVRVNSVHPGIIDTEIWSKMPSEAASGESGFMDRVEEMAAEAGANAVDGQTIGAMVAPVGRAGVPAEIAAGVVFLASEASSYMTGSSLVIDGGVTA